MSWHRWEDSQTRFQDWHPESLEWKTTVLYRAQLRFLHGSRLLLSPSPPPILPIKNFCSPIFLNPSFWQNSVWNVFLKPPEPNHKGLWDGQLFPVYQASSQLASYYMGHQSHAREGKRVRGDSFHQDTLLLCILNTPVLLSYAVDAPLAVDYTVWIRWLR